jgi:hypothetical protein
VRLELDVPATLALAGPVPPVRALVTGPGRELIKLYTTPLVIGAALPSNAGTRWRLMVAPEDVVVPSTAGVAVMDVQPRELLLDVDRLVRRSQPVALRVAEPRNGAVVDSLTITPAAVEISGARSRIAEIDSVPTEPLDLRDVTGAFERTVAVDTTGHPLLRFSPRRVVVRGRVTRP